MTASGPVFVSTVVPDHLLVNPGKATVSFASVALFTFDFFAPLSDHRFMANYFRLYLHAAAMNLLVRLRRKVAAPPPAPSGDVPVASLPQPERKEYQNLHRRQDPLSEGQPATWHVGQSQSLSTSELS